MKREARAKDAYPIIITKTHDGYYVDIPDFESATQGDTIAEAMEMARDAIGLLGIDFQDDGIEIPKPHSKEFEIEENSILTLVDVDFVEYRKKVDNRAVRKNCTIPYWMSVAADNAGINYSRVLQEAISKLLGLPETKII